MDKKKLRTLTDLSEFFPSKIANSLKSLTTAIPDDYFEQKLLAICLWEPDERVDLSILRFYAVWDDTEQPLAADVKNSLEKIVHDSVKKCTRNAQIEHIGVASLFANARTHEEATRKRLAKSIVLFDQETIIPLKALIEIDEEWHYQPFRQYLRTSLVSDKDPKTDELDAARARVALGLKTASKSEELTHISQQTIEALARFEAKFFPYVECIIALPTDCSGAFKPHGILVVINDTDVEQLQRIELKLKIQAILRRIEIETQAIDNIQIALLSEIYSMSLARSSIERPLLSGVALSDSGVWSRLARLYRASPRPTEPDSDTHVLWDVNNTPLWLGKILPNRDLRGYERRRVEGLWGAWQRSLSFANKHHMLLVGCFVPLFVFSIVSYIGYSSGWNAAKIPLFLVGVIFLLPIISTMIFGLLVRAGWGRYSPFIMLVVICAFWWVTLFSTKFFTTEARDPRLSITGIEKLRSNLATELERTTQELDKRMHDIEATDRAEHQALKREIGELAVKKQRLEEDNAALKTVNTVQAEALGRAYLNNLKSELAEQGKADRQWDVWFNLAMLGLGILLAQGGRFLINKVARRKDVTVPLTVNKIMKSG